VKEELTVDVGEDRVATVEFDRPPNNHFDVELITALADAYAALDEDPTCRAIVLCSTGRHFCAGANFTGTGDAGAQALYAQAVRMFAAATPVVAAVQGAAIGGGLGLALSADFRVKGTYHSPGRDYTELSERALPEGYDLREYLDLERFGDALAAADLVVARAGGSVFEIAASGTPAILVPYPHASADHQTANARWMADAGAAVVISDHELDASRLAKEVTELLADKERLAAMARASKGLARPEAARDIAEELLKAAA